MAYVAFDLDATLGFFEITNPLSYLWSPDWLNNPEQSAANQRLLLSPKLKVRLARARTIFANSLLTNEDILNVVLRPDLDVVINPLVEAKRAKKLKSVIIYSNTSATYSMELAKHLIEKRYRAPHLFSLMADHWHPLRTADRHPSPDGKYIQPEKTLKTLQLLFRTATKSSVTPATDKIMFMDDRIPKHKLEAQEADGLTYIVPSAFYPRVSDLQRKRILFLAFEALSRAGLLYDDEYLKSGFCHRVIPYNYTERETVKGFAELLSYVWARMQAVEANTDWKSDTASLKAKVKKYLDNI